MNLNLDHRSRVIDNSERSPGRAHRSPVWGYAFIASAVFLWGISATLGRAVFTQKLAWITGRQLHSIEPLVLSQARTTFSLLMLLPVLVVARGWDGIQLKRRDLIQCLLIGIFGVAASNYFYYLAIQKTNVATAIIIQYTAPVWVLLYVVLRGQQRLTWKKLCAVATALSGVVLVIGIVGGMRDFHVNSCGVLAAVVASFSFAFYNVGGHSILSRYDRWRVLVWTLASASLFWVIVNPPWKIVAANYGRGEWTFLFVFSMLSVLAPFSLYFHGLQYLEPTRAIITSCLEPVFSILLAGVFLGETVRTIQTIGIVLVLAAIVIVQLPDQRAAEPTAVVVEPIE